jgi:hypothetical protein
LDADSAGGVLALALPGPQSTTKASLSVQFMDKLQEFTTRRATFPVAGRNFVFDGGG